MLLIITPSGFLSAVTPLKIHKDQTGILTTIVTLENVYRDYTQGDKAEKVKCCIADHQKQGYRFVMLVGDSDTFPVRFTKTDSYDPNAFNTAFYPTDLYYAALYKQDGSFDNWDANNNGYYGELNGETHTGPINIDQVNLVPTVAVCRVPASTLDEVDRYVKKVIHYEQQSYGANWVKSTLLMATDDWFADACKVQQRIAENYLKGDTNTILCTEAGNLTSSAITQKFNLGVVLVGYIGHGDVSELQIPGDYWGVHNIPQLTNVDCLPVMPVAACSTGAFATAPPYSPYVDVNNVDHKGVVNGEIFTSVPPQPSCLQTLTDPDKDLATNLTVRTSAGVIAYLGGITGMQMYEPVEYFIQGLPKFVTVGEAWQWMIQRFYEVQGLPGSLSKPDWFEVARAHQPWKYMLFGDPSLRIAGKPILILKGKEDYEVNGITFTRFNLEISNYDIYPDKLFSPAPDLPPCGSNPNASRTWVDIFDGSNNQRIYGFCALNHAEDLRGIWFAIQKGQQIPNTVCIKMIDRRTGNLYQSNTLSLK